MRICDRCRAAIAPAPVPQQPWGYQGIVMGGQIPVTPTDPARVTVSFGAPGLQTLTGEYCRECQEHVMRELAKVMEIPSPARPPRDGERKEK